MKAMLRCAVAGAGLILMAGETSAQCVGDCNQDGTATINELITGINVALGDADLSACPQFDSDSDGIVAIAELIAAINNALTGCATNAACDEVQGSCMRPADPVNGSGVNCDDYAGFDSIVLSAFRTGCDVGSRTFWSTPPDDCLRMNPGVKLAGCRIQTTPTSCITSWQQFDDPEDRTAADEACAASGGTVVRPMPG